MNPREQEEFRGLYARLEDLSLRAEQGELGISSFLSPRELHYAEVYLNRRGVPCRSYGGYGAAERRRLYLLPDYVEELSDARETEEQAESDVAALLATFGLETGVAALRITGSGYRTLTHRDFLGSLLGLGLERSVLGDILVEGEEGTCAVVFCEETLAPFLENEMTQVANDKVKTRRIDLDAVRIPPRRTAPIHDTVASPRLDSVVAALCGLSREKARDSVCGGLVEMNFESEDRPDRTVTSPALISVRGFGRYRVLALNDRTKKGRVRLEAEKFL